MFDKPAPTLENQGSESKPDPSPPRKKRRFGDVLDNNDHDHRVSNHHATLHQFSGKENEYVSKEKYLTTSGNESLESLILELNRFYPKTLSLLTDFQTLDQSSIVHTISKLTMRSGQKQEPGDVEVGPVSVEGLLDECLAAVKVVDGMDPLFRSHDGKHKPTRPKPILDHNAYFIDNKFYFERL